MEVKNDTSIVHERISSSITHDSKRKRDVAAVHSANEAHVVVDDLKRPKVEEAELRFVDGSSVYQSLSAELYGWPSKFLSQDSLNFQKSGLLSRFMFYDQGEWKDVSKDVTLVLTDSFRARESSRVLTVEGRKYLVDFVHMLQWNMKTGYVRSVAWIDSDGKCFFPSKCIQGYQAHVLKSLSDAVDCFRGLDSCHDSVRRPLPTPTRVSSEIKSTRGTSEITLDSRVDGVASKCDATSNAQSSHDFALLGDKIVILNEGSEEFKVVAHRFLAGLGVLASYTCITSIFKDCHKSTSGQARLLAFKKQEEVTRSVRGDANIRCAWHGTSKQGVSGIVLHGFGQPRIPKNGAMYGVGVYLAPEDYSHVSAVYSDVDENNEQHMVLCRAIMGSMEQVAQGSEQFHPSSEDYDTGVDDLNNPKRYIIWSTHMNTHILPEYIVSFKLDPAWRGVISTLRGRQASDKRPTLGGGCSPKCSRTLQQGRTVEVGSAISGGGTSGTCSNSAPRSPWMSFPMLFLVMKSKLSEDKMATLQKHYLEFKAGSLSRNLLIKLMRMVAGDSLLADSIRNMQAQEKQIKALEQLKSMNSTETSYMKESDTKPALKNSETENEMV